ncbi:Elongation of fatty acids protein 2 [Dissophora globulifera]|nr:Elongation of fatty acids protein 2 [Dissophora globulifera]
MGVKGLTALLQRLAPQAVKTQHISKYKGKTLAVDVSCFLNRYIYGLDPHPARVQRGVYRLCVYLQLNGIKPIFVFDGEGRIIEKQRESERRAAVKERIEKSFRLERVRKSRLRGLKGSAQLLQDFTPEQVSSILGDIRPQNPMVAAVLDANPLADEDASSRTTSASDVPSTTASIFQQPEASLNVDSMDYTQRLDPLDHLLNLQDDTFENDPTWHNILSSDADQKLLQEHLLVMEGLSPPLHSTSATGGFPDAHVFHNNWQDDMGLLRLDIDAVADQNTLYEIVDNHYNDGAGSLATMSEPPDSFTGISTHSLIPADNLALLKKLDVKDPAYDNKVRKQVDKALRDFVKTMEANQDITSPEMQAISTQRQRVLNELEQRLFLEIKESLRVDSGRKIEASEEEPTAEKKLTKIRSGQAVSPSPPSALPNESLAGINNAENLVSQQNTLLVDREIASVDPKIPIALDQNFAALQDNADQFPGDSTSILEDQAPIDDMTANAEQFKPSVEIERDQDLHAMIHEVLSAHQSIFATLERRTMRVTRPLVLSCQLLLKAMGQPVIEAYDAEAEAVCARLTTLGLTDASVSEDTDTAVFGNGLLLRQVGSTNEKPILEINPLEAHTGLGLTRDAFRDLCILCGTDFSGTIEGIGPYTAIKLIRYYGSIESIMANVNKKPRDDFMYDHARRVFDRTPVVPEGPEAYEAKEEIQPLLLELLLKYAINPEEVRREILCEIEPESTAAASTLSFNGAAVFGDAIPRSSMGEAAGFRGGIPTNSMGVDPFKLSVVNIPEPVDEKDGYTEAAKS